MVTGARRDRPSMVGAVCVPPLIAGVVRVGVVRVGDVPNTSAPVPVSSVSAAARLADEGAPRNSATPAARPDTPVSIGKPVQLVKMPLNGVPRRGARRVGALLNTARPVPVSSVMVAARFADVGAARNAATSAARPETPVEIGRLTQLARLPDAGVPSAAAVSVGPFSTGAVSVLLISVCAVLVVAGDEIGRASCRERVS